MVFAELKTDVLALGYCVVIDYKDGRVLKKSSPQIYTDSKKVFREGGKIFATQDKYSHVIVPKNSFQYLSTVSVKVGVCFHNLYLNIHWLLLNCVVQSMTPGSTIEDDLKRKFNGLSAISPLYEVNLESPLASPYLKFTLSIPFPQELDDVRRPTTAKLTILGRNLNTKSNLFHSISFEGFSSGT